MSFKPELTKLEAVLNFSNGRTSPERAESSCIPVFGSNGPIGNAAVANSPCNAIVIGRVGSYCGSVHFSKNPCWITDNAIRATAKGDNDPRFLYYLLTNLNLNNWRSGSGQPLLNQATLNAIEAPVPLPLQQRAISKFIGALDDRIALSRETNATLEAIAQALFKSWFVDFDPVRAKMEGRAPEGMDEATAGLFPDGVEESELGIVPRGWQPARLDNFVDLAYGKALKAGDRESGIVPVYGSGGITGWHNVALVNTPSVVIGRKGTVGTLYWESRPFFPIDTVFYVKSSLPLTYCYYLLQTLGLKDMNTDAAVPGLNRENVYRLKVLACPLTLLAAFDGIVAPLREGIDQRNQQIEMLTSIRDTLLPRLISGQLRLADIESQIEAIAA
jgi:type I restriction enzyme S subunit